MLDDVLEFTSKQGVTDFTDKTVDEEYLKLPRDITDIESRELGRYLNAFTQQKMFIRTLVSWQEINFMAAKSKYDTAYNKAYISKEYKDLKPEKEKARTVETLPSIENYSNKMGHEDARLKYLKTNLACIEDAIFLLSREVSRRGEDIRDEGRDHNVGRKNRKDFGR